MAESVTVNAGTLPIMTKEECKPTFHPYLWLNRRITSHVNEGGSRATKLLPLVQKDCQGDQRDRDDPQNDTLTAFLFVCHEESTAHLFAWFKPRINFLGESVVVFPPWRFLSACSQSI